jgi:hypothetical protein
MEGAEPSLGRPVSFKIVARDSAKYRLILMDCILLFIIE